MQQPVNDALRFSPRTNRAAEIAWYGWGDEAFAEAARRDRPILLSISAVWCHWCHVMDETTYSDGDVIAAINEAFVAIRVDTDRRPDINARYNMGGWPSTVLLTPDGAILSGATYVHPAAMFGLLDRVARFYQTQRERIVEHLHALAPPTPPNAGGELDPTILREVLDAIEQRYDAVNGGFGTAPKFPQTETLELLLLMRRGAEYEQLRAKRAPQIRPGIRADPGVFDAAGRRFGAMLEQTLRAMVDGELYDRVEGGFFRYATEADWSTPHYEKMAEDHAPLVRLLAALLSDDPTGVYRERLQSTVAYLRTTLRDPRSALFAGSQDADEAYYALPLEERRRHKAPYVDRTSYTHWNAALAGALVGAGIALDDDALIAEATSTLDTLHELMRDDEGLFFHYREEPGGTPSVRGLLADQVAVVRAELDAHEYLGEPRFLARAVLLAESIERRFASVDGGYVDHAHGEVLGALRRSDRPLLENALLADAQLRLAVLTRERAFEEHARRTLAVLAPNARASGIFAATYARALARVMVVPTSVTIVGGPAESRELRRAALALGDPYRIVRSIGTDERDELERRGLAEVTPPVALLCREELCSAPVFTAAAMAEAVVKLFP